MQLRSRTINAGQSLTMNVDISPDDIFRSEQEQDEDITDSKLSDLFAAKILEDESINKNKMKIFHQYKGHNLPISALVNKMSENGDNEYVEKLINKYPNKKDIKSFGTLSLRTIYYTFDPETQQEAAYIINSIRDSYKQLWVEYVKNQIHIKKLKKTEIKEILKKNSLSIYKQKNNKSTKKILAIGDMKDVLFKNYHIDMNVIYPNSPIISRTQSATNSNTSESEINIEPPNPTQNQTHQNETNNSSNDQTNMIIQLIEINKKQKQKFRKVLRGVMMDMLKSNLEHIDRISNIIDTITSSLPETVFIETCQQFDILRKELQELNAKCVEEIEMYKAVPRTKKSRYVGRAEFIQDLDKRIKQYNNEKQIILKRLYELAMQTRSPILLCMASGPCFGLTESSKATMWVSPQMSLTSMQHCVEFRNTWQDFVINKFGPQRQFIQDKYEYAILEKKLKEIVSIAEKEKIQVILDKLKEQDLGHLLTEMEENNIEIIDMEIDEEEEEDE